MNMAITSNLNAISFCSIQNSQCDALGGCFWLYCRHIFKFLNVAMWPVGANGGFHWNMQPRNCITLNQNPIELSFTAPKLPSTVKFPAYRP